MNPLFNQQNGQNIFERLNAFRQTFQGDPKKKVEELLQSGQMTQEQFNQLYSQASNLYNTFNQRNNVTNNKPTPSGNPFFGMLGR